jgi:hypothetical protein
MATSSEDTCVLSVLGSSCDLYLGICHSATSMNPAGISAWPLFSPCVFFCYSKANRICSLLFPALLKPLPGWYFKSTS